MPYVSAAGKSKTSHDVVFTDLQGKHFVRHGGSRAWRNNNPGNIRSGDFANEHGAIGAAAGFAVFPDYAAGHAALKALLKTDVYASKTIVEAVSHYAPPKENNTKAYAANLQKLTGLDGKIKLSSLTDQQLESVVNAIEKLEGTSPGTETPIARVIGAVSEHGHIVAYQLDDGSGILSKDQAIAMARAGLIDAVVVSGRNGDYLRSRPDDTHANNLEAVSTELI